MDIELRLLEIMTVEDPGGQVTNAVMSRVEGQDVPGHSGARVYRISQARARRIRFVLVGAFVTVAAAAGVLVQHSDGALKAPLSDAVTPAATAPDPLPGKDFSAADKRDNLIADDVVGLQPGDEIAYDGKRVFNSGQLTVVQRQSTFLQATLDISRNGQQIRVAVPNEALGLKFRNVAPYIFGMDMNAMNRITDIGD